MTYVALTSAGISVSEILGVARFDADAGVLPERYDVKTRRWIQDDYLAGMFIGEVETENITEAQALEIVARVDALALQ